MNSEEEAQAMRALVQGALYMAGYTKLKDVKQPVDADGNYKPFFYILFESGIKIKVEVKTIKKLGSMKRRSSRDWSEMLEKARGGATLRSLAQEYGVSYERIRQVIKKHDPSITKQGTTARQKAREEAKLEARRIRANQPYHANPKSFEARRLWNKENVVEALHVVYKRHFSKGQVMTSEAWEALAKSYGYPTATTVVKVLTERAGTWNTAMQVAGLPYGKSLRGNYPKRITREEAVAFVVKFIKERRKDDEFASIANTEFDKWRKTQPGCPSVATLRLYFKWGELRQEAHDIINKERDEYRGTDAD